MAICCLARVLRTQNNRRDGMVLSRWRFLRILYISISSFGLKWLRSTFVFTAEATDARDDGKRVSVRVDSNSDSEPKPTTKFQLISIVDCRWCLARAVRTLCVAIQTRQKFEWGTNTLRSRRLLQKVIIAFEYCGQPNIGRRVTMSLTAAHACVSVAGATEVRKSNGWQPPYLDSCNLLQIQKRAKNRIVWHRNIFALHARIEYNASPRRPVKVSKSV